MQTYETLFITSPSLTEDEERTTVESLVQIVTDGGGGMVANERMGRRRLAYPIEKQTDGVYVRFLYDSDAAVPKELERRMGLSDRILRVLTVRLEPKWAVVAKEQAVRDAQARAEAAEREHLEREEAARLAAEAPPTTEGEQAGDPTEAADATPTVERPAATTEAPAAPAEQPDPASSGEGA